MNTAWPGDLRIFCLRLCLIVLFLAVIPLSALMGFGMHPAFLAPVIGVTALFQAGAVGFAAPIGHPISFFLAVLSIGFALILIEFEILDAVAMTSARVSRWIKNVDARAQKITFIRKYGIYTLIPLMWIPGIGLYGGVIIDWIFQWKRVNSIILLFTGWFLACAAVLAFIMGAIEIIF